MADNSSTDLSSNALPLANRAEVIGFVWCSSIFCVLVAIWTGLRIYSRKLRKMPLGMEDLLYHVSVASTVFCIARGCHVPCRLHSAAHRLPSTAMSSPYTWRPISAERAIT